MEMKVLWAGVLFFAGWLWFFLLSGSFFSILQLLSR